MSQTKNGDNVSKQDNTNNSDEIIKSIIQPMVDKASRHHSKGKHTKPPLPHNKSNKVSDISLPNESKKKQNGDGDSSGYGRSSSNRNIVFHPSHPEKMGDLSSTSTAHSNDNQQITDNPQQKNPSSDSLISIPTKPSHSRNGVPSKQVTSTNGKSSKSSSSTTTKSESTQSKARKNSSSSSSSSVGGDTSRGPSKPTEDAGGFPKRFEVQVQARVRAQMDLASQHLTDLPEGSVVTVEEIVDRRARISRPLGGWLSVTSKFGARLLLPTNSKYSKIGGKVMFKRNIPGQHTLPNGAYPTHAKVVDYNEDNGQYKIRYEDNQSDWINMEDEHIQFISQHKAVKVQKPIDPTAPTFTLQTSQAFFNQFFCIDYPQYQAQSSSTTRHMDISPVAAQAAAAAHAHAQRGFPAYHHPSHGPQPPQHPHNAPPQGTATGAPHTQHRHSPGQSPVTHPNGPNHHDHHTQQHHGMPPPHHGGPPPPPHAQHPHPPHPGHPHGPPPPHGHPHHPHHHQNNRLHPNQAPNGHPPPPHGQYGHNQGAPGQHPGYPPNAGHPGYPHHGNPAQPPPAGAANAGSPGHNGTTNGQRGGPYDPQRRGYPPHSPPGHGPPPPPPHGYPPRGAAAGGHYGHPHSPPPNGAPSSSTMGNKDIDNQTNKASEGHISNKDHSRQMKEEFVNKVKEIERRIIQHLHQRGYDESHPDYHRYLQKAKELAIQKASKERQKMLAQSERTGAAAARHRDHDYAKYRQEKQRQHALQEQQRKQKLAAAQTAPSTASSAAATATSATAAAGGGDGSKLTSQSKSSSSSSVKGLIVLRGLPGSGKTTLAKKLAQRSKNARICTEDRYHWSGKEDGVGEYKFQPQLVFLAREWCTKEIRDCIEANVNLIILDNHNARISMYEEHIQYAVQHGYRFRIIEFVATASLIDKYRQRSYKKFPREVYVKLLKLWEHDPRTELINPTFATPYQSHTQQPAAKPLGPAANVTDQTVVEMEGKQTKNEQDVGDQGQDVEQSKDNDTSLNEQQ